MTSKKVRKHVNILGVRVNSTTLDKVLRQVQANVLKNKKFYITTPNPEHVMLAQTDEQFKDILNSSDISISDGIGLICASKFFALPRPKRFVLRLFVIMAQGLGVGFAALFDREWLESELKLIKGREVFKQLIKIGNKKKWNICLLGDNMRSAQKAAKELRSSYLKVKIHPLEGPNLNSDGKPGTASDKTIEKRVVDKINKLKPEIIFIGFGAPEQEKWLYRLYDNLDFTGAMVIGGTLDYMSGKKKTPPEWVDDLNLEWLWRLYKRDQSAERVFKAFPRFALRVFWKKLRVSK